MRADELLKSATSEAARFLEKSGFGGVSSDYVRLQGLFEGGVFNAKSFSAAEIDILRFNWEEPGFDRNWWWQLQPLPFLEWYCKSYGSQSKKERIKYYEMCRDAVIWWKDRASVNSKSPLAWHDHTVAYRSRNLANWMLFCDLQDLGIRDDPAADSLANLLVKHLDWLKNDENYSRRTNHGFDQAMMGLEVSLMFSSPSFDVHRALNRRRLKDEVEFAFTTQGVHKENSPGYQKTMSRRLRQLKSLSDLGEAELAGLGEGYVEVAEEFLSAITLPNGMLPMIGDTRGGDVGLPYRQKDHIDICDYTASGYVVVRGTVLGRDFHLLFKNSHLSHYHRHDDDLSIHLYFGDRVFLGDGGLGSYNETDAKRKLLRSCLSHNAPYIVGSDPIRAPSHLNGFAPRTEIVGSSIVGESYNYGIALRREIDLSNLAVGVITLRDTAPQAKGAVLASNFYSDLKSVRDDEWLHFDGGAGSALRMSFAKDMIVKRVPTFNSFEFGKFSEVSAINLLRTRGPEKNRIEVTLAFG